MKIRILLFLSLFIAVLPAADAAPVHPPGSFVTVQRARLWVESEGKGTPLLLIAGGPGMAHDSFHPYFSSLAATHRVIYFDAFGRGKSDRAGKPAEYTFSRDVEDVEALRKALGLPQWDVLGHSYGTLVAQAYALKYPKAVRRLVLISPLHSGAMWQESTDLLNREIETTTPEVWRPLQRLRSQGVKSSAPAHRRAYQVPPGVYFHQKNPTYRSLPLGYNPDVYYAIAGDDADFVIGGELAKLDFRPRWKSLTAPLLVLAGRYDRIALSNRAQDYKKVPRAKIVMFENSGHFPFIEETAAAIEAIRRFLAG